MFPQVNWVGPNIGMVVRLQFIINSVGVDYICSASCGLYTSYIKLSLHTCLTGVHHLSVQRENILMILKNSYGTWASSASAGQSLARKLRLLVNIYSRPFYLLLYVM